jgi:hypothetical protein
MVWFPFYSYEKIDRCFECEVHGTDNLHIPKILELEVLPNGPELRELIQAVVVLFFLSGKYEHYLIPLGMCGIRGYFSRKLHKKK